MSLLVLAYPLFSAADFRAIQDFRRTHDRRYYSVVAPHVALVYPVSDMEPSAFAAEIRDRLGATRAINFVLRYAALNIDAFEDLTHVFLIPEEGAGSFVRLHDRLYAGKLLPQRRLDIDYIPHVGVGNSRDRAECLRLVEQWNERPFEIRGSVSALDIVTYENNSVTTIDRVALGS